VSALIILGGYMNVYQQFFVQGFGVTAVDGAVYGLVILFFLLGSLFHLRVYLKTKSDTLFLYSLALMLYALGSFVITQQVVFGDVVVWVGRVATYMGIVYFLYALIGSRSKS
jgi:hypothetical protein